MTNASATRGAHAAAQKFLAEAGVRPEFAARSFARLEAQDDALGDSYKWSSLTMLVAECAQEAEDLAAWAACAAVRLEHMAGDPFADRRARALLTAATERAGEADTLLCELRRLIERAP